METEKHNSNNAHAYGNEGGDNQGDKTPVSRAEFDALMATVTGLNTGIERIVNMANERQKPPEESDDEGDEGEETEIEGLETMPRKDFLNVIAERVVRRVNKEVAKPLSKKLDALSSSTQNQTLAGQVQGVAEKNADFWDWKDEMVTIAQEFGPGA